MQSFHAHAEFLAMMKAAKKIGSWRLEDCDVYVTMEPCQMCAGAMIQSSIKNLYYGAKDPKAGAVGSVLNLTRNPIQSSY
jgi:tRNA(adenine34) deaminase